MVTEQWTNPAQSRYSMRSVPDASIRTMLGLSTSSGSPQTGWYPVSTTFRASSDSAPLYGTEEPPEASAARNGTVANGCERHAVVSIAWVPDTEDLRDGGAAVVEVAAGAVEAERFATAGATSENGDRRRVVPGRERCDQRERLRARSFAPAFVAKRSIDSSRKPRYASNVLKSRSTFGFGASHSI